MSRKKKPSAKAAAELAAGLLDRLRRVLHLYPLAACRPWDNPAPRTSQLRALRALLDPAYREGAVFGGNRSGKTELAAIVAALFLLGPKHPAVVAFMRAVGLPLSWIPYRPEGLRVCCVSLTFSESVRVQRPKVDRWLGPGAKWKNRDARKEAEVRLGHDGGGWAIFKANDQGARRMQADAFDLVWIDEEPDGDVFRELVMRTIDRRGRVVLSMTPLRGKTWVHGRFVDERGYRDALAALASLVVPGPTAGTVATWIHGTDNPHVPQDHLESALSSYGEHERAARERGEFVALEGRVYPMFRRDIHEIDPFPIPPEWPRYQGWDFGAANPTSVHDYVHDPYQDVVYVVWERYAAGETIEDHAAAVLTRETCPECGGLGFRLDLGRRAELVGGSALDWDRIARAFEGDPVGRDRALAERWGVACGACEGHPGRTFPPPVWRVADSAGKSERLSLNRAGIRTVAADKGPSSIRAGISAVSARLAPVALKCAGFAPSGSHGPRFRIFRGAAPRMVQEFEGYVWDERASRKTDGPDLPVKKDDHAMDEARYVVSRIDKRRRAGGFVTVAGDERSHLERRLDLDAARRATAAGPDSRPEKSDPWSRRRK